MTRFVHFFFKEVAILFLFLTLCEKREWLYIIRHITHIVYTILWEYYYLEQILNPVLVYNKIQYYVEIIWQEFGCKVI